MKTRLIQRLEMARVSELTGVSRGISLSETLGEKIEKDITECRRAYNFKRQNLQKKRSQKKKERKRNTGQHLKFSIFTTNTKSQIYENQQAG